MRLIAFEIRKSILKKRIIFIILTVLLFSTISGILDGYRWNKQVGDVSIYNEMVKSYEGKINNISENKFNASDASNYVNPKLNPEQRRTLTFRQSYSRAINSAKVWRNSQNKNLDSKYTIDYLTKLCNNLENEGEKDTYLYKDTLKNINMMKSTTEPKYYNNEGWQAVYRFLTSIKGTLLLLIVILVVVTPIFSEEEINGMNRIIFSTKMGRGKIVTAKIITSMLFVVLYVTLFYIVSTLVCLVPYQNLSAINIPLNSIRNYKLTPFNFTVLQGLIISYLIAILSSCAITAICCLISASQKNSLNSLVISAAVTLIPLFMSDDNGIGKVFSLFPSSTMSGNMLFSKYISYNVMNEPILYPILAVIILTIILILTIFFTYQIFYRKLQD